MRIRFAISLILVAAVSILSVVGFAQYSTAREVNNYMFRGGMAGLNSLVISLEQYYQTNGSWAGVETLISKRLGNEHMPGMMEPQSGGRGQKQQQLMLADINGRILIDTENLRVGTPLDSVERADSIELKDKPGKIIGYLFSAGGMQFQPGAEQSLLLKLNTAAKNAALLAGGVAILLAMLLGYLILRPVKQLTLAANQIAGGDLSQRVPVTGKDELAELGKAFNTMAESLEKAQKSRKAMTSDIAHELRTPLAIQRAILEAIEDGVYPLELDQIQHVNSQNLALTRLVEDLRTLSLADAGELKLEKADTNLCELLEGSFAQFKSQAEQRGILLNTNCTNAPGAILSVDPFRIGQVINNLVNNALRHAPTGSTVIGTLLEDDGWIKIKIRDQGKGIPDFELETIFERFFRADHSRSRDEGGTGLGLAIARQLAHAHNGDLSARNHPEGGAEFVLTLPVGQS